MNELLFTSEMLNVYDVTVSNALDRVRHMSLPTLYAQDMVIEVTWPNKHTTRLSHALKNVTDELERALELPQLDDGIERDEAWLSLRNAANWLRSLVMFAPYVTLKADAVEALTDVHEAIGIVMVAAVDAERWL